MYAREKGVARTSYYVVRRRAIRPFGNLSAATRNVARQEKCLQSQYCRKLFKFLATHGGPPLEKVSEQRWRRQAKQLLKLRHNHFTKPFVR